MKNQRKVFQIVKKMNGKSTPQPMSVKSKEGNILTDKDQVKDRWREHFCELLNRPAPARRYHPSQQLWEELDIDTSEPSEEEVEKAINKLKNNKSAGTDSVTAELIKCGGQPTRARFHSLLLKIWQEEQVPLDWKKSELCILFKKGDIKDCKNYRGIALLSGRKSLRLDCIEQDKRCC